MRSARRGLGAELGVEGMALYHHLAGRDELLRAIGDRPPSRCTTSS